MLTLLRRLLLFLLLTLLTQVGGLFYLLYQPLGLQVRRRVTGKWQSRAYRLSTFIGIYALGSILLIPPLARLNNRVPLPVFSEPQLQPTNYFFVFANRHYVKPALRTATLEAAKQMGDTIRLYYLDANFPFVDGFPLLPHRSHDDGGKLDLTFIYEEPSTSQLLQGSPSWLGYGFLEAPMGEEYNQAEDCAGRGYWQYSLLSKLVSQESKAVFSADLNRKLLTICARHPAIKKIFIEPHLKYRLGLSDYSTIRFHGCAAVRHDDHIHLQL